jgi:hypothetical protein
MVLSQISLEGGGVGAQALQVELKGHRLSRRTPAFSLISLVFEDDCGPL